MRFVLAVLLIILFSFIAGFYFPWWTIAIVAFFVALLIPQTVSKSFIAGFMAIFLLWGILALVIDVTNKSILSNKIAQVFPLAGYSFLLVIVTALIGALVGGFAAMSGGSLNPAKTKRRY